MKLKDIASGEEIEESPEGSVLSLKLFVTGASPNSAKAIANLKEIIDKYFDFKYDLEIIDVYQQPLRASKDQIIALPMLLKFFPLPVKKLVGDLSDTNKVLRSLGINP
ncbi:MAG: circadian clock KaiB family protein [Ginsengibacter sp.]